MIGFGSPRKEAGKINGHIPILIHNVRELSSLKKGSVAILARVGAKLKIEMLKKAGENGINILNHGGKNESK